MATANAILDFATITAMAFNKTIQKLSNGTNEPPLRITFTL